MCRIRRQNSRPDHVGTSEGGEVEEVKLRKQAKENKRRKTNSWGGQNIYHGIRTRICSEQKLSKKYKGRAICHILLARNPSKEDIQTRTINTFAFNIHFSTPGRTLRLTSQNAHCFRHLHFNRHRWYSCWYHQPRGHQRYRYLQYLYSSSM